MTKENKLLIILRGIIMENPVLILVLGTCPTLATTTSVISAFCDGAILIIAANEISYKFASDVKEQLERSNCKILGAVLNRVPANSNGSYGRYGKYGKYGKYGSYGSYGTPFEVNDK